MLDRMLPTGSTRRGRRVLGSVATLVFVALVLPLAATAAEPRPALPPGPLHDGIFLSVCLPSHVAKDDPIVHPGEPGASHQHEFFGNTTTDANSTYESLRAGGTTCRIAADKAAMLGLPPVAPATGWRLLTRLARDHYVRLDSNDYSVHPAVIGRFVDWIATPALVAVT